MTVPRGCWGGLLLALVAPGVPALSAPGDARALDTEVRRLIAEHTRLSPSIQSARIAVAVLDQETGWFGSGRKSPKPASSEGHHTAAPSGCSGPALLPTTVTGDGPIQGGVIHGDVTVRGNGDPNISGRFFGGDPTALFRSWAKSLRAAGLQKIEGDVIADDTLFDDNRFQATWDPGQSETWYSAEISALSLNDNCVDITVRPGARPGVPAAVEMTPPSSLITVEGSASTVGGKKAARIVVHRKPATNRSRDGPIRPGSWREHHHHDPALRDRVAGMLRARGIAVAEKIHKKEGRHQCRAAFRLGRRSGFSHPPPGLTGHQETEPGLHAEMLLKTMEPMQDGSLRRRRPSSSP
jgi:D-alanyl-D-alanine carboxypeptidase